MPPHTKLIKTSPFDDIIEFTNFAFNFKLFFHAHVKDFIAILNKNGVDGLLKRSVQELPDTIDFSVKYSPEPEPYFTRLPYPVSTVDFQYDGSYSSYNWELFFHTPMLIATRLSTDQRFEEARTWFHYIFDPTSTQLDPGDTLKPKKRFWQFKPFYDEAAKDIQTLDELLKNAADLAAQVPRWQDDPFNPHLIARMRISAYMKNVVMKYIDNLVAWGDQLFRRDTIESINEATNLYILAYQILAERPEQIPPRATHAESTFDAIKDQLDDFSNTMVDIETILTVSPLPVTGSSSSSAALGKMFYFCVPRNENLLQYWDTVEDRVFKIRHSMNIEGVVRTLPLFEPPIDPLLLIRAFAAGMDLSSILSDLFAPLPGYRFSFMIQKANELCNELKSLGSSLLQVLEKRDAEALALMRSEQEQQLLKAVLDIKQQQVEDAQAAVDIATKSLQNVYLKNQYYNSRPFVNALEKQHLDSIQKGMLLSLAQNEIELMGSTLGIIPDLKFGAPTSIGATFGGSNLSSAMSAISHSIGIFASINNSQGVMASTLGSYNRRRDDWKFQADSSNIEIEQSLKQVISAEIKLGIAKAERDNQQLQIDNAQKLDDYMRNQKFTNQDLYDWMKGQLSTVYFQSYQLAYDLAKKAQQCYNQELGKTGGKAANFIQFGYWDSLKKGLLSGEKLQFDLRRMESSFYDENKREQEITKNISLAVINAEALLQLRATGICDFDISELLFEMDFPSHYFRKIKSVSLSIPCIAGPYTSISARLQLAKSYICFSTAAANEVVDFTPGAILPASFITGVTTADGISTSNAQNDSGMFELNFRDERYMPFEGAGVISQWHLELPKVIRQFDYNTISDIILTIRYTAKEATVSSFKTNVETKLGGITNNIIQSINEGSGFYRLLSLKRDFPSDFYKMQNGTATTYAIPIPASSFPFFTKDFPISLNAVTEFYDAGKLKDGTGNLTPTADITSTNPKNDPVDEKWNLNLNYIVADIKKIQDVLVLINYKLG